MSGKDSRKLHGSWRARVENTAHPLKHYKVQIRVLGLWDDTPAAALPWAEYKLPLGTRPGMGGCVPCEVGDLVWVEFEQGDTRCPIVTGGCLHAPGGVPNMPHESFGGPDAYQHKRGEKQPKPEAAAYHGNFAYSLNGILIELTKEGALRFTHKGSGSAIELTSGGEILIHSEAGIFESASGDKLTEIGGGLTVKVSGSVKLEAGGDYSVKAGGGINFEAGGAYSFKGTGASWSLG